MRQTQALLPKQAGARVCGSEARCFLLPDRRSLASVFPGNGQFSSEFSSGAFARLLCWRCLSLCFLSGPALLPDQMRFFVSRVPLSCAFPLVVLGDGVDTCWAFFRLFLCWPPRTGLIVLKFYLSCFSGYEQGKCSRHVLE